MGLLRRLSNWFHSKSSRSLSPHTIIVFGPYEGINEDLIEAITGPLLEGLSMTIHGAQRVDAIVSSEVFRMSPQVFKPCMVMCLWPISAETGEAAGYRGDVIFEAIKAELDRIGFAPASSPEMELLVDEERKLLAYSFIFHKLTKQQACILCDAVERVTTAEHGRD